ncbi:MAG: alanine--tRNA ligase [Bacteroidetes bacterium HGW-Bacteroidetes-1]|jgi:alanyl-tRNA synthetase|nr:MAG: alanine--tRNA ligase [Bacteroidetes bacterium HGW-Bacteroidetes-1]
MNSLHIRNTFLEFFRSKDHLIVPSAPIVVKNDPTLMFTNAGMNQFKEVFLGNSVSTAKRIADTQKCLRVSGKHNDLEEVGYDTYHHTMFEMLGNWSFGDYFKKEAIAWAWELLTDVYKLDKDRLYITVFGGDEADNLENDAEALNLWKEFVPAERILFGNKKDNFWEMGDSGPCGPCSEIHVDIRDNSERENINGAELVNKDHPEVIEIWNLVFIEFNRLANGSLVKLPEKHVDTGMGFERLTMALQGKKSNYDTDIFQPILQQIAEFAKTTYGINKEKDIAMRVIADHLRAVAFTIADGQLPSNTGSGYVIRRILRRAVRYGFTFLGFEEPFVYKLLPVLTRQMSVNFPEIAAQQELVSKVIFEEESSFLRTLAQGIKRFEQLSMQNSNLKTIDGDFAFELFDTFGFPVDLTQLLAKEKGLEVDMQGFQHRLNEQKNRSRKAAETAAGDWVIVSGADSQTQFVGYDHLEAEVEILRYREVVSKKKVHFEIVFNKTPFYAESGGQVGDTGVLKNENETIEIYNTVKENNLIIHHSYTLPQKPEKSFLACIDKNKRLNTANNHSATHLMHAALRDVLGHHVEQKGSLVDHERLRFDFSHFGKMSFEEIRTIEKIVNEKIRQNITRNIHADMPIDEAKSMGAMALFGEKYGELVRVITFGNESIELCGGTHVSSTGQIGSFRIISESAIAAGIRRIEAVTGQAAEEFANKHIDEIRIIRELIKSSGDVVKSVQQIIENQNEQQKKIELLLHEKAIIIAGQLINAVQPINGINTIIEQLNIDIEMAKTIAMQLRSGKSNQIVVLYGQQDGKAMVCLMISDDLIVSKQLDASAILKGISKEIQGGGGGQKNLATAGGKNPDGLKNAIDQIISYINNV